MTALESLINSSMERGAALGAAVAILQEGNIVYLSGFGTTSVEEGGVQVTPNTLFAYGSICKNLCACLILRLVEQGILDLKTPIVHYLPDLQFSNATYGKKVTLGHLLSHTSGLPLGGKYWGPRDPDSLRRFVYEQIPYYTFLSEPGAVHLYSNTVVCVAGHVAEAVSGKYYDDLVQEYLFDPLQMNRVTFDPAVAMTYPLALPHERDADGNLCVVHRMTYNISGNPSSFAYGSVTDLAKLAQMYLNHGKVGDDQFLSASSVAEMQRIYGSRHIDSALQPLADNYLGYGLGFEIGQYRGKRAAGHGGMNLTYNCFFKLFPDDGAGVIVLTNQSHHGTVWELVSSLYDHALGLARPGDVAVVQPSALLTSPASTQLQTYVGAYLRVEIADLVTFDVVNERLELAYRGKRYALRAIGDDTFNVQITETYGFPLAFIRNENGAIIHLMLGGEPYHPATVELALDPDLELWTSFEGLYKDASNVNLDEMFTVTLRDGMLVLAEAGNEMPCTAIGNRSFLCESGLIEFVESHDAGAKILVWGKATRYYPVDQTLYASRGLVRYLADVPHLPQQIA